MRHSHTAPTGQRAVNHFHEKCPGNPIENRALFLREVSCFSASKDFPVEGEMTHAAGVECYYHVVGGEEELELGKIVAEAPRLRGLCSSGGGSSNQSGSQEKKEQHWPSTPLSIRVPTKLAGCHPDWVIVAVSPMSPLNLKLLPQRSETKKNALLVV